MAMHAHGSPQQHAHKSAYGSFSTGHQHHGHHHAGGHGVHGGWLSGFGATLRDFVVELGECQCCSAREDEAREKYHGRILRHPEVHPQPLHSGQIHSLARRGAPRADGRATSVDTDRLDALHHSMADGTADSPEQDAGQAMRTKHEEAALRHHHKQRWNLNHSYIPFAWTERIYNAGHDIEYQDSRSRFMERQYQVL